MKKLIITTAIILGLGLMTFAQNENQGGIFLRGAVIEENSNDYDTRTGGSLMLPGTHGESTDQNGPLGSGIAVLMGLGAAYMVSKKRKKA